MFFTLVGDKGLLHVLIDFFRYRFHLEFNPFCLT